MKIRGPGLILVTVTCLACGSGCAAGEPVETAAETRAEKQPGESVRPSVDFAPGLDETFTGMEKRPCARYKTKACTCRGGPGGKRQFVDLNNDGICDHFDPDKCTCKSLKGAGNCGCGKDASQCGCGKGPGHCGCGRDPADCGCGKGLNGCGCGKKANACSCRNAI
jgi:hypothetical protein